MVIVIHAEKLVIYPHYGVCGAQTALSATVTNAVRAPAFPQIFAQQIHVLPTVWNAAMAQPAAFALPGTCLCLTPTGAPSASTTSRPTS